MIWAGWTIFSGNFERTIMHKDVKKKPIVNEQIIEQKEVEEVKQNEEVTEDEICISKHQKSVGKYFITLVMVLLLLIPSAEASAPGNH